MDIIFLHVPEPRGKILAGLVGRGRFTKIFVWPSSIPWNLWMTPLAESSICVFHKLNNPWRDNDHIHVMVRRLNWFLVTSPLSWMHFICLKGSEYLNQIFLLFKTADLETLRTNRLDVFCTSLLYVYNMIAFPLHVLISLLWWAIYNP